MRYVINIGSQRSEEQWRKDPGSEAAGLYDPVIWREARAALRAVGFRINYVTVRNVDRPESTYVVDLDTTPIQPGEVYAKLHAVAVALHQDCIAVRVRTPGYGKPAVIGEALVGPGRAKWEPFNPDLFEDL